MTTHTRFYVNGFTDLETSPFCAKEYSALKFGSDVVARKFGYQLAEAFFAAHADVLLANPCVVIPSPYNHVENAATIMTHHFLDRLNELLVDSNGNHAEYDIIHRKVSYTNDYGFLSKEKRKGLIANDSFYLNKKFLKGKVLIFVDDVRITGTHEEKLVEILESEKMKNDVFFLYFANYYGNSPDIEAKINFAAIQSPQDYVALTHEPGHHVIVRPIKYLLGLPEDTLRGVLAGVTKDFINRVYRGCLGEGYYRIPGYQKNFELIRSLVAVRAAA